MYKPIGSIKNALRADRRIIFEYDTRTGCVHSLDSESGRLLDADVLGGRRIGRTDYDKALKYIADIYAGEDWELILSCGSSIGIGA